MKIYSLSKRLLSLAMVCSLSALGILNAATYKPTIDGINYSLNSTTLQATILKYTVNTRKVDGVTIRDSLFYTGDENGVITIPETVNYNGADYTVFKIDANAFLNCRDVKEIHLPATVVNYGNNCFRGCESLTNYPVTETATSMSGGTVWGCKNITEAFIPSGVTSALISNQFAGCEKLKKLTFKASTTPLAFTIGALGGDDRTVHPPLEELVIEREFNLGNYAYNQAPFHNNTTIKRVVIGGEVQTLTNDFFIGCSALQTVEFAEGNKVANTGTGTFQSCVALQSVTLPAGVTTVSSSLFYNCRGLQSVAFEGDITSIESNAFNNTQALSSFTFPETLTSIGASAFLSSGLSGNITLPASLRTIGAKAFSNANNITGFSIPASVTSIGNAAFAPITQLAQLSLAEGNSAFKLENGVLTNASGKRLLVTAHAGNIGTQLTAPDVETIDDYGLALSPFTQVALPALKTIGNYAFWRAAVLEFTLSGQQEIGIYAFSESDLETMNLGEGVGEVPQNLCFNCDALSTVTMAPSVTNIMQNAFGQCTALKDMVIGKNVNYMEVGAVPSTIETLTVLNVTPPVLGPGVFTASQGGVECRVAESSLASYQAAEQWPYLNLVADPTISGEGSSNGCPEGLYFATKDGKLMYKDNKGEVIDTEFGTGIHPFCLQVYKNRVYVADAGKNFRYEDAAAQANGGDGQLFYVNKSGDYFYRVTVFNNVGYKAFEDPFCMYIEPNANMIYISDRNVGIHEMSADAVGLYGTQPFFMQNNWLPYYTYQMSYGAIGAGMQMRGTDIVSAEGATRNEVYWVAKKYNGQGIFRFTRNMLDRVGYSDTRKPNEADQLPVLFEGVQMTNFYLDEENGYLYMFVQKDYSGNNCAPGMYRVPLATIMQKQNEATLLDGMLIDPSPVKLEGAGDEITGVTQIAGDGNVVVWAYISSEGATAVPDMQEYDATNPLHKTGIKMVNAKVTDPTAAPEITYVVEGIAAYGVALSNFNPNGEPSVYGDVNGDGEVTVGDVSAIYDIILGLSDEFREAADVNGDGEVTVGDVSAIYNIILGL